MPWIQINFDLERGANFTELEDALLAVGAGAVTLSDNADDPVLEPGVGERPVWPNTRVTGLFDAGADTQAILDQLGAICGELPKSRVEILEDKDWEREWMSRFSPIQCGERLWICPSWREPEDPNGVNLLLDPGLAFGTGTHPTTFMCLQWLDSAELSGKTVIDYGCGSGILGIAAKLLGAERVIAVDNDPQALIATKDNAERNGVADIVCMLPDAFTPQAQADILLANILAAPLISLADTLIDSTKADGAICLSGILHHQAEDVAAAYEARFGKLRVLQQEDWIRLDGPCPT